MALRSMEVGVLLSELRRRLLAETFQSLNPSQTTSSTPFYNYQLDRVQREQWNDIEWPHLTIYKDMPMVVGPAILRLPAPAPLRQHLSHLVAAGRHLGASRLRDQPADLRDNGRRE